MKSSWWKSLMMLVPKSEVVCVCAWDPSRWKVCCVQYTSEIYWFDDEITGIVKDGIPHKYRIPYCKKKKRGFFCSFVYHSCIGLMLTLRKATNYRSFLGVVLVWFSLLVCRSTSSPSFIDVNRWKDECVLFHRCTTCPPTHTAVAWSNVSWSTARRSRPTAFWQSSMNRQNVWCRTSTATTSYSMCWSTAALRTSPRSSAASMARFSSTANTSLPGQWRCCSVWGLEPRTRGAEFVWVGELDCRCWFS